MTEEGQQSINETFTALDRTLSSIQSLLHGAIASCEFFPNQKAEVHLLYLAQDLTEKAQKLLASLAPAGHNAPVPSEAEQPQGRAPSGG